MNADHFPDTDTDTVIDIDTVIDMAHGDPEVDPTRVGTDGESEAATTSRPTRPGAHPFDPISAVFGLLACLSGALVVTGTVDPLDAEGAGLWFAGAAISIGIALLPWGRKADHR